MAIELLWKAKLAHPQWPHMFVVPCFMTHMWRRDLGKNADILVPTEVPFWGRDQFELLIVAIIFPLAHVSNYTGPWAVEGSGMGLYYECALAAGFKQVPPGAKLGRGKSPGRGACAEATPSTGGGGGVTGTRVQLYVMVT